MPFDPIFPTDASNFSAVVFLRSRFPGLSEEFAGTGTLIGPRLILTAAHNVYDQQIGREAQVTAVFGGLPGTPEIGSETVSYLPEWASDRDSVNLSIFSQYDVGVVRLRTAPAQNLRSIAYGVPTDDQIGTESLAVLGYPRQFLPGGARVGPMYGATLAATQGDQLPHELRKWERYRIFYPVDTLGGMSGGPLYTFSAAGSTVWGVHSGTLKESFGFDLATALRIDDDIKDAIDDWVQRLGS